MVLLSELTTCPGLFYATSAQDGMLSRIRIPGGMLTAQQCRAIGQLADLGGGYVQITNRANVQIRELQAEIPADVLIGLQALELASPIASVDAIRNIMSSPTAGIDRQQLLDVRPLVAAWNRYLMAHPDLGVLSPKFSVCFDGGEAVSVRDRPNDISLQAAQVNGQLGFRLCLSQGERGASPQDTGIWIKPEQSLRVLAALAEVYRDYTLQGYSGQGSPGQGYPGQQHRKPRLRELLQDWGADAYLQRVEQQWAKPGQRQWAKPGQKPSGQWQRCEAIVDAAATDAATIDQTAATGHLGVHQQQADLFYIGVALPLGRLTTAQLQGVAALATQFNSSIRLTPWQNLLLTDLDVGQIEPVQQAIERLGLSSSATHPWGSIVGCSGTTGCKSSATNTQAHALALAAHLQRLRFDDALNIHFSGCEKSCAQHQPSDIALVGVASENIALEGGEMYQVYIGSRESRFGRTYQDCAFSQLPDLIEQMLRTYQQQRRSPNETFGEFVDRHSIAELQSLFQSSATT